MTKNEYLNNLIYRNSAGGGVLAVVMTANRSRTEEKAEAVLNDIRELLARAFCDVLTIELGSAACDWIATLNSAEENPNVCHSHDFVDANQLMLDACARVDLLEPVDEGELDHFNAIVNAAWDSAKRAGFRWENVK